MQVCNHILVAFMLAACATSAHASQANSRAPLADCVNLGEDHQAVRFGTQYVLIENGDAHYRLKFNGSCDALTVATSVEISTDGQANRLCPENSRLTSRTKSCSVRSVDLIDADTYERYKRRR